MKKSKKVWAALLALAMLMSAGALASDFDANRDITVISREDGSGTRGAFIELFKIEQKNEEGVKIDYTTEEAIISNSTNVAMTTVASELYAIGYVSLGSLNGTVKALRIDGVDATVENIQANAYAIARPFNIAVREDVSELAQDFTAYIMSSEGQLVVEAGGYIPVTNEETVPYAGSALAGKIVVGGSSSVTPIMEKLAEAYKALNPNAEIEVQQSDSTTGILGTIEGVSDIGMASRALTENELNAGLIHTVIAMDGIAVIVNNDNPASDLTADQIRAIYMGEILAWNELKA